MNNQMLAGPRKALLLTGSSLCGKSQPEALSASVSFWDSLSPNPVWDQRERLLAVGNGAVQEAKLKQGVRTARRRAGKQ